MSSTPVAQFADITAKLISISQKADALAKKEQEEKAALASANTDKANLQSRISTLEGQLTTAQANQKQAGDPTAAQYSAATAAKTAADSKATAWQSATMAAQRENAWEAKNADDVDKQLDAALTNASTTKAAGTDYVKHHDNNGNTDAKLTNDAIADAEKP
ncbi:hypothetical protein ACI1UM_10695 [Lactococcus petauri]|uniref:hypothetical protein n=1 Tax=Lactococcus petauri TaxID=1940789 RepID=UPI0038551589